ncbi:DUF4625 domain-containing protein [Carboxylicivirga sp. N1Y90]|uniref:DUF4625 domain-containing protein n=1 Tax=Carboxylicivirga fragile TaxID=3417571 RepID=UPI003D332CE9|nr:DUF4625 domain-containing protein [Marinilabiliaceae bacterium N1Y90]
MRRIQILNLSLALLLFVSACSDDNEIDTEKPAIDISFDGAFPVNCSTIYFGEVFELKLRFSDNTELGSYSIDIHNNFDHHSHSTEISQCEFDSKKDPVMPFVLIEDYSLPEGLTYYETSVFINVPSGDGNTLYDDGDYHFYISLTDKEGWSSQKGLSIKMLHR